MSAEIKDGFARLAREREKLTKILSDMGDIGTKRLKCWPLFKEACVIAENYQSDVRKKLKLEIATAYLNDAKNEMQPYGIRHDDFLHVEKELKQVINTIGKIAMGRYKASVNEIRDGAASAEVKPLLSK